MVMNRGRTGSRFVAEFVERSCHILQFGWADVGAEGVAEYHEKKFAAIIGVGNRLPGVIDELEGTAHFDQRLKSGETVLTGGYRHLRQLVPGNYRSRRNRRKGGEYCADHGG